jgi:hypothetical protein
MSAAVRRESSRSDFESSSQMGPAPSLSAVRVTARVSEAGRAIAVPIVGDVRQGAASQRLGDGHVTPFRVLQGNFGIRLSTPLASASCGREVSLENLRTPAVNRRVFNELRALPVSVSIDKEEFSMRVIRSRCLSTKLTPQEYERLEALAGGRRVGEWAREHLLAADTQHRVHELLLAEVLALRTVVVNLHVAASRGEALPADAVQRLIDHADHEKFQKARARLASPTPGRLS